jgi:hypothetical protein
VFDIDTEDSSSPVLEGNTLVAGEGGPGGAGLDSGLEGLSGESGQINR